MRKLTFLFLIFFSINNIFAQNSQIVATETTNQTVVIVNSNYKENVKLAENITNEHPKNEKVNNIAVENLTAEDKMTPHILSIVPFILLLLLIATGPLFFEHFWHKYYPLISILLMSFIFIYYYFGLDNSNSLVHAFAEYVQFISLLTGLFVISGGVLIRINRVATPLTNIIFLLIGAVLSNFIGTTGASILLIRPFLKFNKAKLRPYHVVFFIFIVSNIGGSLTPIGDPPLFLGFLKGVPFAWTITHNFLPWVIAISILLIVFYFYEKNNKFHFEFDDDKIDTSNKPIEMLGTKNFIYLFILIGSIFLDPHIFHWVPSIPYHGHHYSYIRELIMLSLAFVSYKMGSKDVLTQNEFNFEPIKEVAFLFIGIFGTMIPALDIISNYAQSPEGSQLITINTLFWGTGILSGFLDNAPTYINFLNAAMASKGVSIELFSDVVNFAKGVEFPDSVLELNAISIAAVFFGAFTYIGNGPNFMVKSISEQSGLIMPSFFTYIFKFSFIILLPLFLLIWLVFYF